MASKLTPEQVEIIRSEAEKGAMRADLAEQFGVSIRQVGRIVRGEAHAAVGTSEVPAADVESVADAIAAFLADRPLTPADRALAAAARRLAGKLDDCAESQTAGAAAAAPALARELTELVERLRGDEDREPDIIDNLREQRNARRAAFMASDE